LAVALEAAEAWVELEETVNGLRLPAGRLAESLGGPSGRRAQSAAQALGGKDLQHPAHDRGLADTRTARDDEDLLCRRLLDGPALRGGQLQTYLFLNPEQSSGHIDGRKRVRFITQHPQSTRDADFRDEER